MKDDRIVDARQAATAGRVKPGQLDSRTLHDGRIVNLAIDTARFPDGSTGELEIVRHSGAAAVLPVLTDDDDPEILLIRQFRYAAGGNILEVPAGRPDHPDEPWEDCARRELEEETGLVAGNLRYLTTIFTTPGFTDERIHLFVASDNRPGRADLDHDEFLDLVTMRLSVAVRRIRDGDIIDAKSIATILYAATFVLRG